MKRFILAIIICAVIAAGFLTTQSFLAQEQPGKLARLIQDGKRTAALEAIRSGADVNEAQPDGTRPVHWAVYRVDHELLAQLIAKKAKVDVANEFGHTPLAEAVKQGDARLVKMLMDAGSGTEGANPDGQTALMIAIKNGDLAIFQMLIDAGAKINIVEKGQDQTPLMWAAAATRNAAEMVKVLIAKGANVNARARHNDWPSQITSEPRAQYHPYGGLTPLLYAAKGGCYACVGALLDAEADINIPMPEGVTPLMIALDNDQNGVAKLLLDRGANPHLWDVYGRTALYIAIDRAAIAAAAGAAGAGGGRGGPGGGAPAGRGAAAPGAPAPQAAAGRGGQGGGGGRGGQGGGGGRGGGVAGNAVASGPAVSSMEIVNSLLAAGVDLNPQLNMRRLSNQGGRFSDPLLSTGTTPLLRALVGNNMDIARLLIEKGANPNIYAMGLSPFLYAAGITSATYNESRGGGGAVNTQLLDLMFLRGADVNAQVNGAVNYSGRIARALTGDPVNTRSNEGMTALHVAARSGNTNFVRYLLEHGARADIVDASGRTPLDVLNRVPALQPAVFADASGVAKPTATTDAPAAAPPPGPAGVGARGGGNPAATQEIRELLQKALQEQKK